MQLMNQLENNLNELDLNLDQESNLLLVKSKLNSFSDKDKQLFIDRCNAINIYYKESGRGMTTGTIIEKLLIEHFRFEKHNVGQNDLKIAGVPLSFKKITGCKSSFTLNWGNNPKRKQVNCTSNILVFNAKSLKNFKSGFYLINKKHLLDIKTSKNNRSDNVIDSKKICLLFQLVMNDNLFIPLPDVNVIINYNLIHGFNS